MKTEVGCAEQGILFGMTNRIVKDCRVGRKIAPSSQ